MVLFPASVGCAAERVFHDKRPDNGIGDDHVRERLFQVLESTLCSGFLTEMGHFILHFISVLYS